MVTYFLIIKVIYYETRHENCIPQINRGDPKDLEQTTANMCQET